AADLIEHPAEAAESQVVAAGLDRERRAQLDALQVGIVKASRGTAGQADGAHDLVLLPDRHDGGGQDPARPAPERPRAAPRGPIDGQRAAWRLRKFTNRGWMERRHPIPRDDHALAAVLPRQPRQVRGRRLEQGFHQDLMRGANNRRVEPLERTLVEHARLQPVRDARSKEYRRVLKVRSALRNDAEHWESLKARYFRFWMWSM